MYNRTKMNKDMNNNIIKSLRRTLLCTVAAAAVTIGFTACADEMFETQNVTAPANGNGYKISIAANIGEGGTRAVAYNSETGGYDGTFETSDFIYVYNVTKNAEGRKKYEGSDWWEPTYLTPDANGKKVNLVGELSFCAWDDTGSRIVVTPEVGDELMLYYKNSDRYIQYNNNSYWIGEDFIDYAIAKVTIKSIDDNGFIKTSPASFIHPQSLYKINFKGIAEGVKIKKVIIESEQKKLVGAYYPTNSEWPNEFRSVTYNYIQDSEDEGTDQHELIFMLRFANSPYNQGDSGNSSSAGDVIVFKALASNGHYYIGTKSVTNELVDGKYYQAEVAMADAGEVMTLTNTTTGAEMAALGTWGEISTKDADWMAKNTGYNFQLEWFGGNQTLTLDNLSISGNGNAIVVRSDGDSEAVMHKLVLNGVNTLKSYSGNNYNFTPAFIVYGNCDLRISAKSADAKLNIEEGGLELNYNTTMTIESGEVFVNDNVKMSESTLKVEGGLLTVHGFETESWRTNSCIISKGGKLRVAKDGNIPDGFVKAADGYVLNVSDDGEYWGYTAIEDDGSGLAKSIVVMPGTTTLTYGLSDWGAETLRAYVYPETTKDQSVTWKTSNPDVVVVDAKGWIRATGVGVATVTATTNDGTNLSAECIVTVKPVGGIQYQNQEVSMTPESQPFTNPLTKAGKITSITYSSSDTNVATVNASTGEVTITSGATAGQTVTITASATIEEDGVYFYPEYYRTASYTVKLVPVTSQGGRNDYTPGSW